MKHINPRNFGVAIFCIGLILLAVVFYQAYLMLTNPVPGLAAALKPGVHGPSTNALTGAGAAVTTFLLHLLALFVLTIVGSAVANAGIRFYGGHAHSGDAFNAPTGNAS